MAYQWSPSAGGQNTPIATALPAGTHYITVTDQNNCFVTDSITIIPSILLISSDFTIQPICNGDSGTSTITMAGGSGNYAYDWGVASASTTSTAMFSGTH